MVGGSTNSTALVGKDVLGTLEDGLYETSTYTSTGYVVSVPVGRYRVRLLMADGYWTAPGQRVFDVTAEGVRVLSGVDIVGAAGRGAAYDRTFETDVTDGALTIGFVKVVDNPLVAAVEVSRLVSSTTSTTSDVPTTSATSDVPTTLPTTPAPTTTTVPDAGPEPDPSATTSPPPLISDGTAPVRVGVGSAWITRIEDAPLDSNSSVMAANLRADVLNNWGGIAAFNNNHYNNSFYPVPPDQPRLDVRYFNCQNKRWEDPNLTTGPAYFMGVPIPDYALPASGTDGALSVYDPGADQLWELWQARRNTTTGAWEACWGGRVDNMSTNLGIFPQWYGTTGTGVAMSAGMISIDEVRRGSITHAMYLGVMNAQAYPAISWPANRGDGNRSDPDVVRQGQRLRLDPTLDLTPYDLTPVGRMVAQAAQRYGFIVSDMSGAVAVVTEAGKRERSLTGTDPWRALLGGYEPHDVMRNFPWEAIQVVEADWGKPAQ